MRDLEELGNSIDVELTRSAARQMINHLSESMKTLLSEIGSIGRWLTASLLAVNGAGALAVFNAADRLSHPVADSAGFVAGVLTALASGVLLQKASIAGAQIAGEAIGHAVIVEQTGVYHEEARLLASTMGSRTKLNSVWPQLAGWLSAVLFAVGAAVTGTTGWKVDRDNERRCLAIQRDMLSAIPRKKDGAALFQVLGCRPEGAGSVFVPLSRPRSREENVGKASAGK